MTPEQERRMREFDDGEGAKPHDTLLDSCSQFLNEVLPGKNVITEVEAKHFLPLFNKEMFKRLTEEQLQKLTMEYQMKFSMYHPLKIISYGEYDNSEQGVYWPGDKKKHKLITELPPVFKSVVEIGQLGGNASDLMTMFMNTTRSATPMNDRTGIVKDAIVAAIRKANSGTYTDEQKRAYAEQVNKIEHHESSEESPAQMTEDMEWE